MSAPQEEKLPDKILQFMSALRASVLLLKHLPQPDGRGYYIARFAPHDSVAIYRSRFTVRTNTVLRSDNRGPREIA